MYSLLLLNFIVPFVMLYVGSLLRKHPVKDMGSGNGYSTPVSRRSQVHWDYAQKVAPGFFILLGKYLFAVELVLDIVLLFLRVPVYWALTVGMGIGLAFLIGGFLYTDSRIKEYVEGLR